MIFDYLVGLFIKHPDSIVEAGKTDLDNNLPQTDKSAQTDDKLVNNLPSTGNVDTTDSSNITNGICNYKILDQFRKYILELANFVFIPSNFAAAIVRLAFGAAFLDIILAGLNYKKEFYPPSTKEKIFGILVSVCYFLQGVCSVCLERFEGTNSESRDQSIERLTILSFQVSLCVFFVYYLIRFGAI